MSERDREYGLDRKRSLDDLIYDPHLSISSHPEVPLMVEKSLCFVSPIRNLVLYQKSWGYRTS